MIGASITRLLSVLFSLYLILWIQSFAATGVIESRDEGKVIYMNMMIISVVLSAFIFPFVGKLCDIYDERIIVPYAFLTRFVFTMFLSKFWFLS